MIHNIAHRGASAYEPENTLHAFERAIEMGATMLELDVHLSRDERVVIIHDADLARTTDGVGHVSDLSLAEIRRFDAGLGERVPVLEEAIELARGRAQLYIELKGQRTPASVIDVLRRTSFLDGAILGYYPSITYNIFRPDSAWLRDDNNIGVLARGNAADGIVDTKVLGGVYGSHLYGGNWLETKVNGFLDNEFHIAQVNKLVRV